MASLSGMQLVFHGGKCCGIKTVYCMGTDPAVSQPSLEKMARRNNRDQTYGDVSSDMRFFTDSAPEESGKDRLQRYITFMERNRPRNVLEVVLCESSDHEWQDQSAWVPTLQELGFKMVNRHSNSNSGNFIQIWHLNVGETADTTVSPSEDDDDDDC